jgi:hypothetical protein
VTSGDQIPARATEQVVFDRVADEDIVLLPAVTRSIPAKLPSPRAEPVRRFTTMSVVYAE